MNDRTIRRGYSRACRSQAHDISPRVQDRSPSRRRASLFAHRCARATSRSAARRSGRHRRDGPLQLCPFADRRPRQERLEQGSPLKLRAIERCTSERGDFKQRALELSLVENCALQLGQLQRCALQLRLTQPRALQPRIVKRSTLQLRFFKLCTMQPGAIERRRLKLGIVEERAMRPRAMSEAPCSLASTKEAASSKACRVWRPASARGRTRRVEAGCNGRRNSEISSPRPKHCRPSSGSPRIRNSPRADPRRRARRPAGSRR